MQHFFSTFVSLRIHIVKQNYTYLTNIFGCILKIKTPEPNKVFHISKDVSLYRPAFIEPAKKNSSHMNHLHCILYLSFWPIYSLILLLWILCVMDTWSTFTVGHIMRNWTFVQVPKDNSIVPSTGGGKGGIAIN